MLSYLYYFYLFKHYVYSFLKAKAKTSICVKVIIGLKITTLHAYLTHIALKPTKRIWFKDLVYEKTFRLSSHTPGYSLMSCPGRIIIF